MTKRLSGERIKCRRKEIGLTQSELAWKIGLRSTSAISQLEAGTRDIWASRVPALADALQCEMSDLYEEGGETIAN